MATISKLQHALVVLSLVGVAAGVAASDAAAFGHFHGSSSHVSFNHGGGGGGGFNHTHGPTHYRPTGGTSFGHPSGFGHAPHPHYGPVYGNRDCHWSHSCGSRTVIVNRGPVYSTPVYSTPVYTHPVVYADAPAPTYSAPAPVYRAAAPAARAVCTPGGTFVTVMFQPTATSGDITAFLKSYNVTLGDGPNADGLYRIRLSDGAVSSEQTGQVIESMKTQTNIVSSISG